MSSETSTETEQIAEAVTREHALDSLTSELEKLLGGSKKHIDETHAKKLRKQWDQLSGETPEDDRKSVALKSQFELLRERIHAQVERRNAQYATLESDLEALKAAIKKDDLQESQSLEQKIINGMNKTRGLSSQRQQTIIQALEALQPRIKKLVSWRHWGTVKAREQVIEEIKSLHDNEKDLEKIARRIKQAREEWKQWDNAGEGGDKKLYKTFDDVCTAAYEPCRKLFESQRKQREAMSKHRAAVCETLESFYEKADWREPDWKAMSQMLREQSSRWRKLGPAEYRDRKPLQKRYDEIMARFDGPLDRERKRNLRARQDIIESVVKLGEMEDNRRAINELQKIKKQWIVTVSGKRNQEQKLWKQFTAACDAVYQRGRDSKKAFEAELKDNLTARRSLIGEIESTSQSDSWSASADPAELASTVRDWRKRWSEMGRAPRNEEKTVEQKYKNAIGAASKQLKALEQAAQADRDRVLLEHAALCAEIEAQVVAGSPGEAEIASFQDRHDALPSLPESSQSPMEQRFQTAMTAAGDQASQAGITANLSDNFDQINALLLQLEIRAEIDSPAEFAKQRMALQINRLSAAMGKAKDEPELDTPELVIRIHTLGAVTTARQAQIDDRFRQCFQALNGAQ